MKVFFTGASGFVGNEVVRELLAQGHRVRALVRPPRGFHGHREITDLQTRLPAPHAGKRPAPEPSLVAQASRLCSFKAFYLSNSCQDKP